MWKAVLLSLLLAAPVTAIGADDLRFPIAIRQGPEGTHARLYCDFITQGDFQVIMTKPYGLNSWLPENHARLKVKNQYGNCYATTILVEEGQPNLESGPSNIIIIEPPIVLLLPPAPVLVLP